MNVKEFLELLTNRLERDKVSDVIADACARYGFEGIVLEVWTQLSGRVDDSYLLTLVSDIGMHNFVDFQGVTEKSIILSTLYIDIY